MKKIFITLLAVTALSVSFVSAQNARRAVGDKSLDLGVGFHTAAVGYSLVVPPVDAAFEYTVLDWGTAGTLSAGGLVSFGVDKYSNVSFTSVFVGPLACYRFPIMENLDLFGKVALGYCSINASETVYREVLKSSGFAWAGYVGATYYFSEKLGVGFQLGTGLATAELHLTIKL